MSAHTDLVDPTLVDGRYRLGLELGAGAFGSVYKATQVVMDKDMRDVALKLFHSDSISVETLDEMMNDALQILALVSGLTDWEVRQHFVEVYDLGVTRKAKPRGFVSMELVRGGSLEGRIRDLTRFTIPGTFHYLKQISRAMAFMHEKRFVHSDLKPANILVFRGRENDLIKIGDFGLAGKYVGALSDGPRGGTLSYLAPEALAGFATTPGCDVFSLGLIAHEMLTGKNPYNDVGVMLDRTAPDYDRQLNDLHRRSREVPLSIDASQFPELSGQDEALKQFFPLLDIVNKMLAVDLTKRYSSARGVFEDLQRIEAGRPPGLADDTPILAGDAAAAQDPLESLEEQFNYALAKEDWGEATRQATAAVREAPDQAIGYRLRSSVFRRQAEQVRESANDANKFRSQAIRWLNKGLDACDCDDACRRLRHDLADVYQEMGEYETAQQIRRIKG